VKNEQRRPARAAAANQNITDADDDSSEVGGRATEELLQLELDFDADRTYEQIAKERLEAFYAGREAIPF
jgi:hypothetical protein